MATKKITPTKETPSDDREDINSVNVATYAQQAYLDYAMSVVCGRAIPYLEDGQKPVQRRLLYAMNEMRLNFETKAVKSAKIIGSVLGSYHPHGDQSVYDAMVRQTQHFVMRYPLVHGEGNFGSRDGDSAAAMRYCFTGDTRIATNLGLLKISDIPQTLGLKEEQNHSINLSVASINNNEIASKWLNSGIQDVYKINTAYGYNTKCTINEPLYVLGSDLEHTWKTIGQLSPGDRVAIQTKQMIAVESGKPLPAAPGFPTFMSKDLATFLGLILSDGSIRSAETTVEFGSSNDDIVQIYKDLCQRLFPNINIHVRVLAAGTKTAVATSTKPHHLLTMNSAALVRFLKQLGCDSVRSFDKRVPEVIFRSSAAEISAFLAAYYEGDGSISILPRNKTLSLASSSYSLLEDVKLLLLTHFGIISQKISLSKKANAANNSKDCYRLIVSSIEHILKYSKSIGFIGLNKKTQLLRIKDSDVPLAQSSSFFRSEIPQLSEFLTHYLKNDTAKTIHDEFGKQHLKSDLFPHAKLSKFKLIKTHFKLKYWLTKWTELAKLSFPSLWLKLNLISEQNFFYDEISSIEKQELSETVYDLTVSNTHAFIANGFIAHNTEAKLSNNSKFLLRDLNSGTVDFRPNYDGTTTEPDILPSRLPFILMNGAEGVGVGMASSIPPHRAADVTNAAIAVLKNPNTTFEEVMEYIPGPDFPTGGQLIQSREKVLSVYKEGNGTLKLRGRWNIESGARGTWKLIINELPYGVSPQRMMEQIDALFNPKPKEKGSKKEFSQEQMRLKQLLGNLIDVYRDESGKDQAVRVVFEPKSSKQNPEELVSALLAYTGLQETIKFNFVVVGRDRRPSQLGILAMLKEWGIFRVEVTRRRLLNEQAHATRRLHIVEGRLKILGNLQEAIRVIQESDEPKAALMAHFGLSEEQATDVLDMRLRQLARLEGGALEKEKTELEKTLAKLKRLLAKTNELVALVIEEMEADLKILGEDPRRTIIEEVADADDAPSKTKAIARAPEEAITVALSEKFWVRAKTGLEHLPETFVFKTGDPVVKLFPTTSHSTLFGMDHTGRVYNLEALNIPNTRGGEGLPLASVWDLQGKITHAWIGTEADRYILMSDSGHGFISTGQDMSTRLKAGKTSLVLSDKSLPLAPLNIPSGTPDTSNVVCLSSDGSVVSFALSELPTMGKGKGLAFLGLRDGCTMTSCIIIPGKKFGVIENGKTKWCTDADFDALFGKRSSGKKGKKMAKTVDATLVAPT